MPAVTTTAAPTTMQGIAIPPEAVNPSAFFRLTRRHILLEKSVTWAGQLQDVFSLRKSDILAGLQVRVYGTVVVTPGTGAVASTARWPYDFIKSLVFAANGQSQLIQASGLKLKVRDVMKRSDLNDRGVTQTIGGVSVNQGTLSSASESWGVGSNTAAIAAGTYNVDFTVPVPIAEDMVDLTGAIFLQTSSSDLSLTLNYAPVAELFTLSGNGAVTVNLKVDVLAEKFSIPVADGHIVVPDLRMFHSIIQNTVTNLAAGVDNEPLLIGQALNKSLLRTYFQLWNNNVPVPLTSTSFGNQGWRYGNAETPDLFPNGSAMRQYMERYYNTDIGGQWGFGVHEFASENVFRDVVDMSTTADLRLVVGIANGVVLTNPKLEVVTETVFVAGSAV